MADEIIGEAAAAVAEGGGEVDLRPSPVSEAMEHPDSVVHAAVQNADSATLELINRLSSRVDQLESDLAASLEKSSRYATTDHAHPPSSNMQTIFDALDEIEREEQAPNRKRFWQKKLFGG